MLDKSLWVLMRTKVYLFWVDANN